MMRKKIEFSKIIVLLTILIVYPSTLYLSWRVLELAKMAIDARYTGALPYLTALITPIWAAFATILGFYFNKAKAENKEKIKNNNKSIKRDY